MGSTAQRDTDATKKEILETVDATDDETSTDRSDNYTDANTREHGLQDTKNADKHTPGMHGHMEKDPDGTGRSRDQDGQF